MEQVYWKNPKAIQYKANAVVKKKKYHFSTHRPWTQQFWEENAPGKHHAKVFVEPIKEWSYFRGDRVEVLVGKDKGKQGIVKQIFQERNWVIVEGLNCKLKRVGETKDYPGFYVQDEQPLLVTTDIGRIRCCMPVLTKYIVHIVNSCLKRDVVPKFEIFLLWCLFIKYQFEHLMVISSNVKVVEKLVTSKCPISLKKHLPVHQSCFRKGHSTVAALANLNDNIFRQGLKKPGFFRKNPTR